MRKLEPPRRWYRVRRCHPSCARIGRGPEGSPPTPPCTRRTLCHWLLRFLGELDARGVQLPGYFRDIFGFAVDPRRRAEVFQRRLPLRNRFLDLAQLEIHVAQVVVDRGVLADAI